MCVEVIPDEPCPQPEFSADSVDRYLVDVYSRFAMFRQVINEKIITHLNTSLGLSLTKGMEKFQEKLGKIQDSLNKMWDRVRIAQINGTESMGSFTDFRKAIASEFFNVKEYLTVFRNNGKSLLDDAIKKSKVRIEYPKTLCIRHFLIKKKELISSDKLRVTLGLKYLLSYPWCWNEFSVSMLF